MAIKPIEVQRTSLFKPLTDHAVLVAGEKVYYAERQHWAMLVQPFYETGMSMVLIAYAISPWTSKPGLILLAVSLAPAAVLYLTGSRLRVRLATDPFTNPRRQANRTPLFVAAMLIVFILVLLGYVWVGLVAGVLLVTRMATILARWSFYERRYITNRRVIEAGGMLGSQISSMPLARVTDINYTRSVLGELLGFSSMRVETAGQDQALGSVHFIDRPEHFYEVLVQFSAPIENVTFSYERPSAAQQVRKWRDTRRGHFDGDDHEPS